MTEDGDDYWLKAYFQVPNNQVAAVSNSPSETQKINFVLPSIGDHWRDLPLEIQKECVKEAFCFPVEKLEWREEFLGKSLASL